MSPVSRGFRHLRRAQAGQEERLRPGQHVTNGFPGASGQPYANRPGGTVMHLTPRELDKLLIYMLAEVALKRKEQGLKLNHPEAVAVISAAALDGARAGRTLAEVMTLASKVLTRDDVMDGVAGMIPRVQLEAVFDDGSRLITVHSPIQ
jgi:urease subunit gamma